MFSQINEECLICYQDRMGWNLGRETPSRIRRFCADVKVKVKSGGEFYYT